MANRRDVLQGGAALPACRSRRAVRARARRGRAVLTLERFVFDVRFAESGAIAEHDRAARRCALAGRRRSHDAVVRRARSRVAQGADGARRRHARGRVVRARDVRARSRHARRLSRRARARRGRHASCIASPVRRRSSSGCRRCRGRGSSALATALTECPLGAPRDCARRARHRRRRAVAARRAAVFVDHRAAFRGRVSS